MAKLRAYGKLTVDEILRIAFTQNPLAIFVCDNCTSIIGEAKSPSEAKVLMEKHWETCPMNPTFSDKVQEEMK